MPVKEWARRLLRRRDTVETLRTRLGSFRALVEQNSRVLRLIADAGEILGGEYIFDRRYPHTLAEEVGAAVHEVVFHLGVVTGHRDPRLGDAVRQIDARIQAALESRPFTPRTDLVIPLCRVTRDMADVVGDKMARLGEVKNHLACPVPDGFVISAHACQRFFEAARIPSPPHEPGHAGDPDGSSPEATRDRIRRGTPPRSVRRAVGRATRELVRRAGCECLVVRSSALGEDGQQSFAGQFASRLGVPPDGVLAAYREVVASLVGASASQYREAHGLPPEPGLMAVGCMCLVQARASGVVYSLDPSAPDREVLLVTAVPGLGSPIVDGSGRADRFEVSRDRPHRILSRSIAPKNARLAARPEGGTTLIELPDAERSSPAVTDAELEAIVTEALRIERYMKCAQDVEWAIDDAGRLQILQARPLAVAARSQPRTADTRRAARDHTVLLRGAGTVACRGIASGPVRVLRPPYDPDQVSPGEVIVARTSSPRLAAAVARSSALITDIGSPTGHLATVAREFRVPMVVDALHATEILAGAGEVTVDAEENVVYQGRVSALLHDQLVRSSTFEDAPEFRMLRKVLRWIAPLNLKDPQSPEFAAENCSTYHDVIRLAHEEAVRALVGGHSAWVSPSNPYARRLRLSIPLELTVVDLGDGLSVSGRGADASSEDVTSAPLRAVLDGLQTEDVWATGPADMDLDGFMASATRTPAVGGPLPPRPEQNLAFISRQYLHLNLRLGYHFNVVDSYLTERPEDNFVYFRFAGGVTELIRRSRRAALLRQILEHHDFVVEGTGDLVIGRAKNLSASGTRDRLQMVGRLIGFSRQLDILLRCDASVDRYVQRFLAGRYDPICDGPGGPGNSSAGG